MRNPEPTSRKQGRVQDLRFKIPQPPHFAATQRKPRELKEFGALADGSTEEGYGVRPAATPKGRGRFEEERWRTGHVIELREELKSAREADCYVMGTGNRHNNSMSAFSPRIVLLVVCGSLPWQ